MSKEEKLKQFEQITHQIVDDWYERVKQNYVTEADSRDLGIGPELKSFHEKGNHRIKFVRLNASHSPWRVDVFSRARAVLSEAGRLWPLRVVPVANTASRVRGTRHS